MRVLAMAVALLMMLAALATLAPATLLDARVGRATQGQLRLADTAGTVWSGRGLIIGEAQTWSVPVGWTVDPWSLLRGDTVVTLYAPEVGDLPRGTIRWRNGALVLDGVALTVPAAAVQETIARGNALALGGWVAFDAPHFSWDGRGGDGAASVRWNDARVAVDAGDITLGTVTVHLTPSDGRIQGHVDNRGGHIRIDGELALSDAGSSVNATVSPLPTTPPAIQRALAALGTPDAAGAVRLQWRSGSR